MISSTTRERWNTKTIMTLTFLVSVVLIISLMFVPEIYGDWKNIQISVACSILASNLIMYLSSRSNYLNAYIGVIIITVLFPMINFLALKFLVFSKND